MGENPTIPGFNSRIKFPILIPDHSIPILIPDHSIRSDRPSPPYPRHQESNQIKILCYVTYYTHQDGRWTVQSMDNVNGLKYAC